MWKQVTQLQVTPTACSWMLTGRNRNTPSSNTTVTGPSSLPQTPVWLLTGCACQVASAMHHHMRQAMLLAHNCKRLGKPNNPPVCATQDLDTIMSNRQQQHPTQAIKDQPYAASDSNSNIRMNIVMVVLTDLCLSNEGWLKESIHKVLRCTDGWDTA